MKKEKPMEIVSEAFDEETEKKLFAGLRGSGMRDEACTMCTRAFLTRHERSRLCPPCRMGKPDGWTPAHTMRKARLGDPRTVKGHESCPSCQGLGVAGWQPGAPTPPCGTCEGLGQILPPEIFC